MESLAEFEFQNHEFELLEEAKDEVYARIERECRTTPFVGMKQPTPVGGMLGHELVLTVKHNGIRVKGYCWELLKDGASIASGITDAKGQCRNLPIPFPYTGLQSYTLKIYPQINKDTSVCNIPTEVSMQQAVVESIRQFLFEQISQKYPCTEKSDYRDTSYIDFSEMIRIDVEKTSSLIHVGVGWTNENPTVIIYVGSNGMSYKFWDLGVDIAAPDFGQLWDAVEKYLEEAIAEAKKPQPAMDD